MSEWISVKDQLPPSGKRVMFAWVNSHGKDRTSIGQYNARFTEEASDIDCEACEYSEEKDQYFLNEGWQEWGWETEYSAYVSDPVTHWMPLPAPPEAA